MREGLVIEAIERAALDPVLRAVAANRFAINVQAALGEKPRTAVLRGSDCGRCSLELWADVQGALTIPTDVDTQLARYDAGNLTGAWLGALLQVGAPAVEPSLYVQLEHPVMYRGIPISVDSLIRDRADDEPLHVTEFKSTYVSKSMDAPHVGREYQVLQAGLEALGAGAPEFTVVTFGPSAYLPKHTGRLREDRYETASWKADVDREVDRLEAAASRLDPPEADPKEPWRCRTCNFGACARNVNPLGGTP